MGKTKKQNQSSFEAQAKELCDKIVLLSEAREESLSKLKREASKGREDTQEMLHNFRHDREKLSQDQRENLRQEAARRRQHVAAMISGFRKSRADVRDHHHKASLAGKKLTTRMRGRPGPGRPVRAGRPSWNMQTASGIVQTKVSKDK